MGRLTQHQRFRLRIHYEPVSLTRGIAIALPLQNASPNLSYTTQFPTVDPIPLPAPLWLFKVLLDLTLSLHLAAVDLLLGGLILALAFAFLGRLQPAGIIIHRLPTLMAFVINLGIPPLLFAQVLYGRALYTSSVLIGVYWIGVIALLMASYYSIYLAASRANDRRNWLVPGLAALLLVLTITFIYSNNMTLMIRPQAWPSMYHGSPAGMQLNTSDPTLLARWLFFISGATAIAGAALALLALRPGTKEDSRRFLMRGGGAVAAGGMLLQSTFADLAYAAQPPSVMSSVIHDPLFGSFAYGWIGSAVLLFVLGLLSVIASGNRSVSKMLAIGAGMIAFLNVAATVMVRDGVRDFTLRAAGFDVWDRHVVTNWSVVCLFLVLFVAGLAVIGYLISVVARARRIEERYA